MHSGSIIIGCPPSVSIDVKTAYPDIRVMEDLAGASLSEILNRLLHALPQECEFVGWLGDDDRLLPESVHEISTALAQQPMSSLAYGGCDYINTRGETVFTNRSNAFAAKLLRFGPQLIPQPGSLWRRTKFCEVDGLSPNYDLAFDFDLFLKLSRVGDLVFVPMTVAQFRWHPDSLSVKRRWHSAVEASRVRRAHYTGVMRVMWPMWDPLMVILTWLAGGLVSARIRMFPGSLAKKRGG